MPRIHTKRDERRQQIKDLIVKVISEDLPPEQIRKEFQQYYSWNNKGNNSLFRYVIKTFYPEYQVQYLKWAERHNVLVCKKQPIVRIKPDYAKKVEKPEDTKAFLGYHFEDITRKDLLENIQKCTRY